jgi:hypothetical protein
VDDDEGAMVTVVVACWASGGEVVVDVARSGLVPCGVEVGVGDVVGDGRGGAVVAAPGGGVVVGTTVVVDRGTVVVVFGVMMRPPFEPVWS